MAYTWSKQNGAPDPLAHSLDGDDATSSRTGGQSLANQSYSEQVQTLMPKDEVIASGAGPLSFASRMNGSGGDVMQPGTTGSPSLSGEGKDGLGPAFPSSFSYVGGLEHEGGGGSADWASAKTFANREIAGGIGGTNASMDAGFNAEFNWWDSYLCGLECGADMDFNWRTAPGGAHDEVYTHSWGGFANIVFARNDNFSFRAGLEERKVAVEDAGEDREPTDESWVPGIEQGAGPVDLNEIYNIGYWEGLRLQFILQLYQGLGGPNLSVYARSPLLASLNWPLTNPFPGWVFGGQLGWGRFGLEAEVRLPDTCPYTSYNVKFSADLGDGVSAFVEATHGDGLGIWEPRDSLMFGIRTSTNLGEDEGDRREPDNPWLPDIEVLQEHQLWLEAYGDYRHAWELESSATWQVGTMEVGATYDETVIGAQETKCPGSNLQAEGQKLFERGIELGILNRTGPIEYGLTAEYRDFQRFDSEFVNEDYERMSGLVRSLIAHVGVNLTDDISLSVSSPGMFATGLEQLAPGVRVDLNVNPVDIGFGLVEGGIQGESRGGETAISTSGRFYPGGAGFFVGGGAGSTFVGDDRIERSYFTIGFSSPF